MIIADVQRDLGEAFAAAHPRATYVYCDVTKTTSYKRVEVTTRFHTSTVLFTVQLSLPVPPAPIPPPHTPHATLCLVPQNVLPLAWSW